MVAPWRRHLDTWIHSPKVQNAVMAIILLNAVTIGVETMVSHDSRAHQALSLLDHMALGVFLVEIALKLIAVGPLRFFRSGWNTFDFLVVAVALVPGAGPLSVLRTLRIMRLLRVIKFMPGLRRVVEALLRSLPGISAIALLMGLIFYVAAVMATTMFGPAFPEWFGSIGRSLYSLFQIMTLESWSMGIVRPIMEHNPWAWAFFVPFILVSAFTMLNLFVAVIVDTMGQMDHEIASEEQAGAVNAEATNAKTAGTTAVKNAAGEVAGTGSPAETTAVAAGGAALHADVLEELRALRHEIAELRASQEVRIASQAARVPTTE